MTPASLPPDHVAMARPDWLFRILVTALLGVAAWLLVMPWVPAIARCTMQRFHLRTGSFVAWAIQQPIPPMYSFANTTEVRNLPPDFIARNSIAAAKPREHNRPGSGQGLPVGVLAGRTINHFPTREFTFANARFRYLRDRSSKWFVLRSTYRGQSVQSVYRLDPATEAGWTVTLVEEDNPSQENES